MNKGAIMETTSYNDKSKVQSVSTVTVSNLSSKGDEVVLTSGMAGRIVTLGEVYLSVDIADNVLVKVEKSAIAKVLPAVPNLWPNTPIGFVIQATGERSAFSILQFEVVTQQHPVLPYRSLIENLRV